MKCARLGSAMSAVVLIALLSSCTSTGEAGLAPTEGSVSPEPQPLPDGAKPAPGPVVPAPEPPNPPRPIGLEHWVEADFPKPGPITVENDTIFLGQGNDMTGIRWTGPLVRMNYEITLDAKRVAGNDFFCGLTFPVGDTACSLILGGWGGRVVGLSSLEYRDAVNNATRTFRTFEQDRWYFIQLRVTREKIEAWIDDEQVIELETAGRHIDVRWEMEKCRPLGIATWRTTGAIRYFHMVPIETSVE